MLWLPTIIVAAVVLLVGGVFLRATLRHETSSDEGVLLVGVVAWVIGTCVSWMFTYFDTPTAADWWHLVAVRVVVTVVGTLAGAGSIFWFAKENGGVRLVHGILAGVLSLLALVTIRTSTLDLIEGPITVRLVDFDVQKVRSGARGGSKIFSTLQATLPDGSTQTLGNAGWESTTTEDLIESCNGKEIDLLLLEHLGRVIDAKCIGG